jgi:hypothetical protein
MIRMTTRTTSRPLVFDRTRWSSLEALGGGKEREEKRTREEKALGGSGASKAALSSGGAGQGRWVAVQGRNRTEPCCSTRVPAFQAYSLPIGPGANQPKQDTWSTRTSNRLINRDQRPTNRTVGRLGPLIGSFPPVELLGPT